MMVPLFPGSFNITLLIHLILLVKMQDSVHLTALFWDNFVRFQFFFLYYHFNSIIGYKCEKFVTTYQGSNSGLKAPTQLMFEEKNPNPFVLVLFILQSKAFVINILNSF